MPPSLANGVKSTSDAVGSPPPAAPDSLTLLQMSASVAGSGGNGRTKVPVKPGRSLLDWMKLGRSGKDLTGTNGRPLKVTSEELAKHSKEDDAWMVLNEKRDSVDSLKVKSTDDGFHPPSYCWSQTETTVKISINVGNAAVENEHVIIDQSDKLFHLRLLINDYVYHIKHEFEDGIGEFTVTANPVAGNVEVVLTKEVPGKMWLLPEKDGIQDHFWKKRIEEDVTFRQCTVTSLSSVTHDTKLLCLEFPLRTHMVVPVGCHVFVNDTISGESVTRAFSVVPPFLEPEKNDERVSRGRVLYLLIKIYPNGLLTPSIDHLKPGDKLDVSTTYAGNFRSSRLKDIRHLIMYAAGTGFTPMASLLRYSLIQSNGAPRDMQLVFFIKQQEDILWKEELDRLSSNISSFSVHYVLLEPHDEWKGLTGHVRKELMETLSPKPADEEKVLLCACGPTLFTQKVIKFAGELGYSDEQIFAFVG